MAESPRDQFEEIAEEVTTHPGWANPKQFAHAFRDHFAQQTCPNCQNYIGSTDRASLMCAKGVVGCVEPSQFSCKFFTAKDR